MPEGILGRKLGMTQIFDQYGQAVPVTIIQAGPCVVLRKKTSETDGYNAVQLAFEPIREKLLTKPQLGEFHVRQRQPMRFLREFRLREDEMASYSEGQELKADLFATGDLVDVIGTSKGRGFSGVIRRHHFSGAKGSHGVHEYFRHGGSIGTSATPGRVVKGRKMAGQHGNRRVTVQNLTIVRVEPRQSLIMVRGAVPGPNNGLLLIHRAMKG